MVQNVVKGVNECRFFTPIVNDFVYNGIYYNIAFGHSRKNSPESVQTFDFYGNFVDYFQSGWLIVIDKSAIDYKFHNKYNSNKREIVDRFQECYYSGLVNISAIYPNENDTYIMDDIPNDVVAYNVILDYVFNKVKWGI